MRRRCPQGHSYFPCFYFSYFTSKTMTPHFSLGKSFRCLSFDSFIFVGGGTKVDCNLFIYPISYLH